MSVGAALSLLARASTSDHSHSLCSVSPVPVKPAAHAKSLAHVHVVYATPRAHFAGLLTSMISLASHAITPATCTIHLIVDRTDIEYAKHVVECFKYKTVSLNAGPIVLVHRFQRLPFPLEFYKMPLAMYWTRIFLDQYLPTSVLRAIWLDHDTIIKDDIGHLYRMHMDYALAGAPEFVRPHFVRAMTFRDHVRECEHVSALVRFLDAPTFNTGILVLDLDKWRTEGLAQKVTRWAVVSDGCFLDQLALNLAFQGGWDHLDWRWNARFNGSTRTPANCARQVRIFHWNTYPLPKFWQSGRNSSSTKDDYLWRPYAYKQCGAAPWGVGP